MNYTIIILTGYVLYFAGNILRIKLNLNVNFKVMLWLVLALHLFSLVARAYRLRFFPMLTVADTLVLLGFFLMLFHSVSRNKLLGQLPVIVSIVFICISVVLYHIGGDTLPIKAFQSWLLPVHVGITISGYTFLTLGFINSIIYLYRKARDGSNLEVQALELSSFKLIVAGYAQFSIGALVLGSIWARIAWGRFWGWDPKETFSLITFLIYSLYVVLKFIKRKEETIGLAVLAVFCYLVLMFTYLGVPFILSGLHSYL